MKKYFKFSKLAVLAGVLPFIYGCGGGGTGALLSTLFGVGATGAGISSFIPDAIIDSGGTELATLHQPEPASMLLIGGGIAAMTYFKSKAKRNSK